MSNRCAKRCLTVLAAAHLALAAPAGAATIQGTVTYEGRVPNLRPVSMGADPGCAEKHHHPVPNEVLVLGEGNTMGNIFVHVTDGLPAEEYPPPADPAVLDQKGCRYVPHVLAVQKNQVLKILNSDGLLHNVHALPEVNQQFNMAMPGSRVEAEQKFDKAEPMFKIKCDVHPWMASYLAVLEHPFYDVTAKDGRFEISGLPAGTYEIEAWHEKLGTRKAEVTVGAGDSKDVDFTMSPPAR